MPHLQRGKGGFCQDINGLWLFEARNGSYNYKGATDEHLKLMRKETGSHVQIKAAGGVRTLDDLIRMKSLGVTRVGATATEAMLEEARKRGIGQEEIAVDVR